MSKVASLINRLEANARDELAGQDRMLRLLEEQERAIVSGKSKAVIESTEAIETETQSGARRASARAKILRSLAAEWRIPADAMTMASIVERAGGQADRLIELRTALRTRAAQVLKKNRKLAALANMHRKVMQEVIDAVLASELDGEEVAVGTSGTLIDAEA